MLRHLRPLYHCQSMIALVVRPPYGVLLFCESLEGLFANGPSIF
ncbi:hypothetical protein Spa11_39550 [Botrimarina mediterranea]|uniref:Uncharacterized protein n=1 Tax=Botrimarina mediterranea TaxID=2528022 RepID=A0A518KD65_9BACT|nr:hypothetical protein Spa11_39550 [Botrimarina mediterranea]